MIACKAAAAATTTPLALLGHEVLASPLCKMRIVRDIILEEEGIPPHPADMMGTIGSDQGLVKTRIDIYQCIPYDDKQPENDQETLVIFAAGAPLYAVDSNTTTTVSAGKNALSVFATTLAERGYLAVMADKPNLMMNMSSFLSVDFLRVIEYMQQSGMRGKNDEGQQPLQISAAVIGGHGIGGSMAGYALTRVCPAVFCPWPSAVGGRPSDPVAANQGPHYKFDQDDLATLSLVKAAFWYGSSAFQGFQQGAKEIWVQDPTMIGGSGIPLLMMYGSGEDNYLGFDQRGLETYQQWGENGTVDGKAILVLEGLDHNGITDVPITPKQNTIPSTLPVDARVDLVVDSLVVWLDTILPLSKLSSSSSDDYLEDFCEEVQVELGATNVELCLPDDNSNDDDDDAAVNLGLKTGIPVGIFGLMMALFLALAVKRERRATTVVSHHGEDSPGRATSFPHRKTNNVAPTNKTRRSRRSRRKSQSQTETI